MTDPLTVSDLQSGVLASPADEMLGHAIGSTLNASPPDRAELFERLVLEIEGFMAAHPEERPWTCSRFTGTDGSLVFRGGVGLSVVIDPSGRLWRARNHEDFETTYHLTPTTCEIATLTPLYAQMREYVRR
ncbi:MAG TPA: hypothetical protein VNN08_00335 [Thermoanaerobaculia bacterium]|nr:hypothetical protein [Thermoanaerobaculia bacterium]